MTIADIITKHKLNKQHLASKIGMSKQLFQKKLDDDKFTNDESILLRSALIELRNDLDEVSEISFDEAMQIISQKKA